ncbi:DEAD/DEAH box helicase family protein [Arthrobacter sp. TMP15]|uniref:DEAD/DEAH box helicase family protein n=1 Tax=Arthrobacter sp. TMP15 TaxID=3140789 RepID=UPI0031BAD7F6
MVGLAQQIAEDIDERVWLNLGLPRPMNLGGVKIVRSAKSFLEEVSKPATQPTVFVATFAMALEVLNQEDVGIEGMARKFVEFGGVIVDECHYEPAPSWSQAIRAMGLGLPICLRCEDWSEELGRFGGWHHRAGPHACDWTNHYDECPSSASVGGRPDSRPPTGVY